MKMDKFVLTDENYYSREAEIAYMSCSQYQSFCKCEAATLARLHGVWEPKGKSDALLQGNYFHSYMESQEVFQKFCDEHFSEIYKTKVDKKTGEIIITGKYAPFVKLDEMIQIAMEQPFVKLALSWKGENEKFMIGEIGGVQWRMKMDRYCDGRRIIDWKTSADIRSLSYNPQTGQRETFIEEYGYMMRAAVYGEIERQNVGADTYPDFIIFAITKQDPPDKETISLNDDSRWELELERVKERLPRFQQLKEGHIQPKRCGQCEYCRSTKMADKIIHYTDLMPQYRMDNPEYDDFYDKDLFAAL